MACGTQFRKGLTNNKLFKVSNAGVAEEPFHSQRFSSEKMISG